MHNKTIEQIMTMFKTTKSGLSSSEAKKRIEEHGPNEITGEEAKSIFLIILDQFKDFIVILLLATATISMFIGEAKSAITIFVVLLLNAILGVIQQIKAQNSLDALKSMSTPSAKVVRDGIKIEIPANEVTMGDLIMLDAGDYVAADGRIVESFNLQVAESALTGEAESVIKTIDVLDSEHLALGDRKNMVYSGSFVTYGRGAFLVTGVGLKTEIGKIATMIASVKEKKTPIQVKLDDFGKKLSIGVIIICAIVFGISLFNGNKVIDSFMFAVALAVAAVPEALASIVTISLAIGTNKMAKAKAIVKTLPVVEALGSAGVICSDKTGTLTQNKMTVVKTYLPSSLKKFEDYNKENLSIAEKRLLDAMILCNDASFDLDGNEIGDPTETALISFGIKIGYDIDQYRTLIKREGELSFDSDRKLMSTKHKIEGKTIMLTKGAPDVLLNRCSNWLDDNEVKATDKDFLDNITKINDEYSEQALRVLAYAYKEVNEDKEISFDDENDLIFIGLTGMIDPPREEVKDAVAKCDSASIKTVMITGDHKTTAVAIAKELGIFKEDSKAVIGLDVEKMSDEELKNNVKDIAVYARVSPEHKIRIVKAWQEQDMVVAMTGDGVNDAPALKQADIGIAMGITGTEVSKEAAGIILADDNFSTIVNAVEGGRTILTNIKKSIAFLLTGNLSGVMAVLYFAIFHGKEAFLPVHLLFVNLATDSLPAIAYAFEKKEKGIMKHKPVSKNDGIFNKQLTAGIALDGIFLAIMIIISFFIGDAISEEYGRTMAFATLVLARLFHGFNLRSSESIIKDGLLGNKFMLGGVAAGVAMLAIVLYVPFMRNIFEAEVLSISHIKTILMLSLAPTVFVELRKIIFNKIFK